LVVIVTSPKIFDFRYDENGEKAENVSSSSKYLTKSMKKVTKKARIANRNVFDFLAIFAIVKILLKVDGVSGEIFSPPLKIPLRSRW
jgi:hypothetical protein